MKKNTGTTYGVNTVNMYNLEYVLYNSSVNKLHRNIQHSLRKRGAVQKSVHYRPLVPPPWALKCKVFL